MQNSVKEKQRPNVSYFPEFLRPMSAISYSDDEEEFSGGEEEEMTENPLLLLRATQARASRKRTRSLEKKKKLVRTSPVPELKDLLFDGTGLPRTAELFESDSLALPPSHVQDQRRPKPSKPMPYPLIEEDFINILTIRKVNQMKATKPPAKKLVTTLKKEKRPTTKSVPPKSSSRPGIGPKLPPRRPPEKKKPQTPPKEAKSNWRNYPKPWRNGMSKKLPKVKSSEKSLLGTGRGEDSSLLHIPPLTEFDLDLQVAFQQRMTLGLSHKSSTQGLIQMYEERKPIDELTFEDAIGSIPITKPQTVALKRNNSIPNSNEDNANGVVEETAEVQVVQDAAVDRQDAKGSTGAGIGEAGLRRPFDDLLGRTPSSVWDENSNFPGAAYGLTNGFQMPLNRAYNAFVEVGSQRWEAENGFLRNSVQNVGAAGHGHGQTNQNQFQEGRNAYRVAASLNPGYADAFTVPHLMQPVLSPLVGNFVWNGRLHQSAAPTPVGALPLYQLNYFPEIHDQFPPPLLPVIPPPRAPADRGYQRQGQMNFNQLPEGHVRNSYRVAASLNPAFTVPLMQPVLSPLLGNFVWNGRLHQSGTHQPPPPPRQ